MAELSQIKKLVDYKPLNYFIKNCDLEFELSPTKTIVKAVTHFCRNEKSTDTDKKIILDGEKLKLVSIKLESVELSQNEYEVTKDQLIFNAPKDNFKLEIITEINPQENTELEGLYLSSGIFCTQNEAEGFRKITYYLDRPDNMAIYSCRITANKKDYPILLANGNLVDQGNDGEKHWALWQDPFPKPCYLFALVAGDLGMVEDYYVTTSGRKVKLQIFVDKGNEYKCGHAMESLKKSMKWDEDTFGLEYDLDIYMIVAVDSFNMGAMENKGLNIFNSAYVLADEKTATDLNFLGVESVIGHEYFHNWTGNRITCRDWFQLTLKEGLTVFRDQEFSADLNTRTVKRIEDVAGLRGHQFNEDNGPSSHPIKPSEYLEINNFYTSTIYEKGAEVIRMMHTMLGKDGFRKGMDKYFELFDGQAVTTDDFVYALSVANDNYDFSQFKNWYSQKGTPKVKVISRFNEATQEFILNVQQFCPKTLETENWKPFHFPLKFGMLDQNGNEIIPELLEKNNQEKADWQEKGFIHIREKSEEFKFSGVEGKVVLSLNRDFSAPIILETEDNFEVRAFLLAHDKNSFNRYETAQNLAIDVALNLIQADENGEELIIPNEYIKAFGKVLMDTDLDDETKSWCLGLPTFSTLSQKLESINTSSIFMALEVLKKTLAINFENEFLNLFNSLNDNGHVKYNVSPEQVGLRSLKNIVLGYLLATGKKEFEDLCFSQFQSSLNMTDEIGTLTLLSHYGKDQSENAVESFYNKWKNEPLVFQKWVATEATSPKEDVLEKMKKIEHLPEFDFKVPNLVRSLVGGFMLRNPKQFHRPDGLGYEFLADKLIEIDSINPQIAARMASGFNIYDKLQSRQKNLMKVQIQKVLDKKDLSKNTFEILSKIKL